MRIDIVTIFPDMFRALDWGVLGKARQAGRVDIRVHDLRSWTRDRHRTTDDTPYGGGPGLVMKVEPLVAAVEEVTEDELSAEERAVILLSPRGTPLRQDRVESLATMKQVVLVAGRYEDVDERFLEATGAEEISIGDYVLSGGEIPAMVVVDAVVRIIPGAISDPLSAQEDSFSRGLLDCPHYTRPVEFRGMRVPEVLLSGNHAAIRRWRKEQALRATRARRPELLASADIDEEERDILNELEAMVKSSARH
jgi:tRNA (guanine37-N1)-methyltransferase